MTGYSYNATGSIRTISGVDYSTEMCGGLLNLTFSLRNKWLCNLARLTNTSLEEVKAVTTSIILRLIPSVHFNPSVELLVLSSVRKIKATQSQYYDLVKRQLQAGQTQCKQIILNS